MPPPYAPKATPTTAQPAVPQITVELTPALIRHYWEFFAALREQFILTGEHGAAMECATRMDWLLDQEHDGT